jgi:subtilisin family serine protease
MRSPQSLKKMITAVVLFSLCTAFVVTSDIRVRANQTLLSAQTLKLSPDLQRLIESGNGNKQVKVIVQSKSTGLLGSLLQTVGGTLNSILSNLNISIVNVTASGANLLAADSNVTYVSLDAPVRSSGHVTTTTGVQQVRAQKNSATLDGSGVTIAILDSGIDSKHKSFATPGKIKFSKDFTGENRTDDPWGHGTHVAAIAAGDGAPTSGAYEGVAPAANLVNLRVLNSDGVGTISGILSALDWDMANKTLYNILDVNMSLVTTAINYYRDDPI